MIGAGKRPVVQQLAERLGCRWYDLDRMVEQRLGQPVHDVFARTGEAAFREAEASALAHLAESASAPYVLATGGGTPLKPQSQALLWRDFLVIWLDGRPEVLFQRAESSERPLASQGFAAFARLYAERRPLYKELAQLRVNTEGQDPEKIATALVRWWKEHTDDRGR